MGFSASDSDSEASNSAEFNQNVFNPAAFQKMQGQFNNLFGNTQRQMNQLQPGATQQMQDIFNQSNPAWQQQLQGGAYQGMNLQNNYNQALQGGGNEQFINESIMGGQGNDYVDAMKQQMQSDAWDRTGRTLANIDQRSAGRGMGGSSRQGILQARAIEDEQDRLGSMQTQLGVQAFDKDLDRKMNIARNADQFDLARLNSTSGMLGNQNQAMMGGLNFGQGMQNLGMGQYAPSMQPWQAAGAYANAFGAPTVLGSGSSGGMSEADSSSVGMSFK